MTQCAKGELVSFEIGTAMADAYGDEQVIAMMNMYGLLIIQLGDPGTIYIVLGPPIQEGPSSSQLPKKVRDLAP